MGRKKKTTQTVEHIEVKIVYSCKVKDDLKEGIEIFLPFKDVSFFTAECDMCGSHSTVEAYVEKCQHCGQSHYLILRED